MVKVQPYISPAADPNLQLLVQDPEVQKKVKEIIGWAGNNVKKIRFGKQLFEGINIATSLARLNIGIKYYVDNRANFSVKEKILSTALIFINLVTLASGITSCYDPHIINKFNILLFGLNNFRLGFVKYAPMLLCNAKDGSELRKVLELSGGSTRSRGIDDPYFRNNASLDMNTLGRLINATPMIGRSLVRLICKISLITAIVGTQAGAVEPYFRISDGTIQRPKEIKQKSRRLKIEGEGYNTLHYSKGEKLTNKDELRLRIKYS